MKFPSQWACSGLLRGGGADDVDPVQFRLRGDFVLVPPPRKAPVCDVGDEVLADLAFVDDLADVDPDLVGVFQPARGRLRGDLFQYFLGGGQQGFALAARCAASAGLRQQISRSPG
jgi:hypothetical protein